MNEMLWRSEGELLVNHPVTSVAGLRGPCNSGLHTDEKNELLQALSRRATRRAALKVGPSARLLQPVRQPSPARSRGVSGARRIVGPRVRGPFAVFRCYARARPCPGSSRRLSVGDDPFGALAWTRPARARTRLLRRTAWFGSAPLAARTTPGPLVEGTHHQLEYEGIR